jgi:phosphoenolpyruvate-protein kinase (PTS system EI component)
MDFLFWFLAAMPTITNISQMYESVAYKITQNQTLIHILDKGKGRYLRLVKYQRL